ncbi:ArdC-like ssDNA-binding domain-containing protein [Pseudarthrobacter sp. ATCC 49987]|uniref:ArdC-like ssDNA-binding domain-containing protein n=1 Tax=Pseudarthrobacter sp. ATCC 49987 TaxID=2698204 RepID=UPI00136EEB2B|nr:ArdC-like ssDNA-binding domain-containing protein [Pseudarthrobacter sp. ATCC 49987]
MTTERLTTPPHWSDVLKTALELPGQAGNTYNRFRRFSLGNQALLMMQGVMEPVNTYKGWLTLNRQVKKGSKAKAIYVPMFRKEPKERKGEGEEEKRLSGFKLVPSMFGVSETDGDDLPEYEPPHWSKELALRKLSVTQISYDLIDGNTQGYSLGKQFAINPVAVYPFKTLQHELSHIVAGHTSPDELEEYRSHRGIKEFEAEGSAYLILNELGVTDKFDAAESRAYIQSWLKDQKPEEPSIRRVFTTADRIVKAGMPEGEEEDVQGAVDTSRQPAAA